MGGARRVAPPPWIRAWFRLAVIFIVAFIIRMRKPLFPDWIHSHLARIRMIMILRKIAYSGKTLS